LIYQESEIVTSPSMTILVAEDDPITRLMLVKILARWGYEVAQTDDGGVALERILEGRIDLVVTDWEMPGLSGEQLCRQVRERVSERYVYMLLLTSHTERSHLVAGLEAGADDYLTKPFDPVELRARLSVGCRFIELDRRWRTTQDELCRVNAILSEQAATDPLMGIGNRRAFEQTLERVHADALRHRISYSLVMADIDYFKRYNDRYGHQGGDQVLRRVAHLLRETIRRGDELFRYGGEEIVLVLPRCAGDHVTAAADRLRQAVFVEAIEHLGNPPGVVTLSFGCSSFLPEQDDSFSPHEVLEQADQALYQAKEAGRNRVERWRPPDN
jgi:diguanylate cyclase (GGDEF)-like protein